MWKCCLRGPARTNGLQSHEGFMLGPSSFRDSWLGSLEGTCLLDLPCTTFPKGSSEMLGWVRNLGSETVPIQRGPKWESLSAPLNVIFLAAASKFDRKLDLTHCNTKGQFGKCTFPAKIISQLTVELCFRRSSRYHLVYLFLLPGSIHSECSQVLILSCLEVFAQSTRDLPDNSLDNIQSVSKVPANYAQGPRLTFVFQHVLR